MLVDDRPAFPMCFFVRMNFTGCLRKDEFERALRMATDRHPLLSATILDRGRARGRLAWENADHANNEVQWVTHRDAGYPPYAPLNVRETAGLCVRVIACDDETTLILRFHHACCDAIGAYQFATDLLIAYANEIRGPSHAVALPPIDPARLAIRGRFDMTPWKWVKLAPRQLKGLLGVRQFLMRQPVPMIVTEPRVTGAGPETGYPTSRVHTFDETATSAILKAAKRRGVTVNDLLVRDLFLAISDVRRRAGRGQDDDWLRLSIPMNLRGQNDARCSASNFVSLIFLDRRPRDCVIPEDLLTTIQAEMNLIKRNRLGFIFLLSLRAARALPGGITRANRKVNCDATAVLSNLGQPFKDCPLPRTDGKIVAGNVRLEHTDFLPPFRPYTSAVFSITTYADRLAIALHYDSSAMDEKHADDLHSTYVRCIRDATL